MSWRYEESTKTLFLEGDDCFECEERDGRRVYAWSDLQFENVMITGVDVIPDQAFSTASDLICAVVGDGVSAIGEGAFSNPRIVHLSVSDSVTEIGASMCYRSFNLRSVILGRGVTRIPDRAFQNCSSLTMVECRGHLEHIGKFAFCDTAITETPDLSGVKWIGDVAFGGCHITRVKLPEGLEMGSFVFWCCTSLNEVSLPKDMKDIPEGMLLECGSLSSVWIPRCVCRIGPKAFKETALRRMDLHSSVVSVGEEAFCGCEDLRSVDGAEGLTSIGDGAFKGCRRLEVVKVSDRLVSIGSRVFYGCRCLRSVYGAGGLTSIGDCAFEDCRSLEAAPVSDRLVSIGSRAFYGCSSIKSVTLPVSLQTVGTEAFSNCGSLETMTLPDPLWGGPGYRRFLGRPDMNHFYAHDTRAHYRAQGPLLYPKRMIPFDRYHLFRNRWSDPEYLSSFGIGNDSAPGDESYLDFMQRLTALKRGDGPSYRVSGDRFPTSPRIPGFEFEYRLTGCPNLKHLVSLSSGKDRVRGGAVYSEDGGQLLDVVNAEGCEEFTVPDGVVCIGPGAFSGCTRLVKLSLPDSVASLSESAFSGCTALEEVRFSGSVEVIPRSAFDGDAALRSVTGVGRVRVIGDYAFYGCSSLKEFAGLETAESLGRGAFEGSGIRMQYSPASPR